jgi:hypothetical protein
MEALKSDSIREESNFPHSQPRRGHYPLGRHATGVRLLANRPSTAEEQPKVKNQTKSRACKQHIHPSKSELPGMHGLIR